MWSRRKGGDEDERNRVGGENWGVGEAGRKEENEEKGEKLRLTQGEIEKMYRKRGEWK